MSRTEVKKSRFNIFDALIILVVLACIAAIIARYYFISSDSLDEQVSVEFIVPGVMDSTAQAMTDAIKSGTVIYLSDGDQTIGFIQSIYSESSKVYATNAVGDIERVNHPSEMDIKGVAVLYGTSGKSGFLIGGNKLATVSDVVFVYTTDIEFAMTVTSISEPAAK